ncbi:MAG: hypothetical protein COA57_01090 [Flavobacteriales bacterium]|nr:MAG: hypothetical protein COA57_01090 [Flavobacteriales bacterium]
MKLKLYFIFWLFTSVLCSFSQDEVLEAIPYNYQLLGKTPATEKSRSIDVIIHYIKDTIQLPFVDDFSLDKIKRYDAKITDANIIDSAWVKFKVDGAASDSVAFMWDTTYMYVYNTDSNAYDVFPNTPMSIEWFTNFDDLLNPVKIDTVWPPYTVIDDQGILTVLSLTPDSVDYNFDTVYFVPAEGKAALWQDTAAFVYINNTYGIDPITIGVATFDGVDHRGMPYDFTIPSAYGLADVLTSKPVFLGNLPTDSSVILSFYYQPQGNGNVPDAEDSIALEFYAPALDEWRWMWSIKGEQIKAFVQVKIPITNTIFLLDGFQFRFKNYATLSGNFDHWNLDYVHLDKNRSMTGEVITDVGFVYQPPSLVKSYTAMPWRHYMLDSSANLVDTNALYLRNLGDESRKVTSYYNVFNENNSLIYVADAEEKTDFNPGLDDMKMTVHDPVVDTNIFTLNTNERAVFEIKNYIDVTPDDNRENDTVIYYQNFDTYYAYDDGSAEKVYALTGYGAKLAYKFTVDVIDTLKGVYFYFPQTIEDVTLYEFQLVVWKSLNPEQELYRSGLFKPNYNDNNFIRYEIDDPLVLSGTFYVGWEQLTQNKIYLGFDENNKHQDKIFYNTTGNAADWTNTFFDGALTIRPDFGVPLPIASIRQVKEQAFSFDVYPNPNDGNFKLRMRNEEFHDTEVVIYNILGETVYQSTISNQQSTINLSAQPPGIYFVKLVLSDSEGTNNQNTKKIIISR